MLTGPAGRATRPRRRRFQCVQALPQHQGADHAEQDHVGERDEEIELAGLLQEIEDLDAGDGAEDAAADQEVAHLQVDVAAPPMAEGARHRGGHHLAGAGADGDARRHAEEDEQRRHDEFAADAEHAGQEADRQPDAEQQKRAERQLGDRKVDLHGALSTRREPSVPTVIPGADASAEAVRDLAANAVVSAARIARAARPG